MLTVGVDGFVSDFRAAAGLVTLVEESKPGMPDGCRSPIITRKWSGFGPVGVGLGPEPV